MGRGEWWVAGDVEAAWDVELSGVPVSADVWCRVCTHMEGLPRHANPHV